MDQEKKDYEISFLLNSPEAESEVIEVLNANQIVELNKGHVSEIKLSYPIKKRNSAFFGFYQFKGVPEVVRQISEALKLKSNILRFLLIKRSSKIVPTRTAAPLRPKPSEPEPAKPKPEVLSNELLEKKLEEILK